MARTWRDLKFKNLVGVEDVRLARCDVLDMTRPTTISNSSMQRWTCSVCQAILVSAAVDELNFSMVYPETVQNISVKLILKCNQKQDIL